MTDKQPDALWLAERLDPDRPTILRIDAEHAGVELRRLRAQRDGLQKQVAEIGQLGMVLRDQRDELLAALKDMATAMDAMGDMPDGLIHPLPWRELRCEDLLAQARAAIAKVEGEKP